MSKTNTNLNELIEVLNDGVSFYEEAARNSKEPSFSALFERMASTKREIATELKTEVSNHGEKPATGGTLAGSLRKGYTELRSKISARPDATYVAQLEQTEDRILQTFQDALAQSDRAEVRQIAQRYLPDVKRMHDEMRNLKGQLKHAA